MKTHLSIEDLKKYIDISDGSEEYLLWMEDISDHLENCEKCQKVLEEMIMLENTLKEESFADLLRMAEHENDIRRSIVVSKLQAMYQEDSTRNAAGAIVAEAIRQLQMNAVKSYMFQISNVAGYAGGTRGEDSCMSLAKDENIEIVVNNSELLVKTVSSDKQKKFTAVLDRKGKSPVVCEASREEESKQWVAKFNMDELMEPFEVYIIE